jgi:hypothetical protein
MRIRLVHSRRTEEIHRWAIAFIRGACGAVSATSMPIEADTASNAAVNLASRSRIRWVKRRPASSSSPARLRATWVAQAPIGWAVTPSRCTRRLRCSITNAAYRRFKVTVSTWKKSTASKPLA